MKKMKPVYLPKWQRWFMIPIFVGIWVLITYLEFFSPNNDEQLGMIGYLILSGIFLGLAVMIWLMSAGKLPAYMIEDDDQETKK